MEKVATRALIETWEKLLTGQNLSYRSRDRKSREVITEELRDKVDGKRGTPITLAVSRLPFV